MICRIWRGCTTRDNAEAYRRIVSEQVIPQIEAMRVPGFRHIDLMRTDQGEEIELTTQKGFDSLDAMRSFMGEDYSVNHAPAQSRAAHREALARRSQTDAP